MSLPQLSADDQRDLRDAASDAWKQSSGLWRRLHAREIFKRDPRVAKFDAATIILLVQIAWKLWQFWRDNKISDPSDVLTNSIMLLGNEPRFGSAK